MAENFELVVIGGGPGGYTAALEAAAKGMKTALVENRELGGTCLNRGCIPTKTILHSAELYRQMQNCGGLGVHAESVSCDMAGIQARKAEVVSSLRSGIGIQMKKNKVKVVEGTGTITGTHEVCVNGSDPRAAQMILHAENILIATGSVPSIPPIPGAELTGVMDSDGILASDTLYPRLTIVGGGVIGMEFASIYSAFGCEVTVIEFLDRILANMDKEISQNLKMILKKRGVDIHTGAGVERIERGSDGSLICYYREKDVEKEAVSDAVLVAAGRRGNTEGLFGPEFPAPAMERGRILVSEYGQTSVPNIYAAGDVTPGVQLAHAASAQGINAVAHILWSREQTAGGTSSFEPPCRADLIPACVYTDPEIATVGLTQEEAKARGISAVTKKYPMSANGKSVLTGQERGFIKVTAEESSHRILGAQMMCARATDMISEFGTAIANGLTLEQMASVVRPHPTFSEGITEAARMV